MRPAVAAVVFACLLVTLAAMSTPRVVGFTVGSGPIAGTLVRLRPGLGKQAIALPSPQPWLFVVAESR